MDTLPPAAVQLAPLVYQEAKIHWPELKTRSVLAAQIDKETCISPRHRLCWNPRAELKTSREYGFGLGQFTIAYTPDGRERFNKYKELKSQYPKWLAGWTWVDRFQADYQIRAMVLMNRSLWIQCSKLMEEDLACTFAAYNGGLGGVMSDRRLCAAKQGCNQRLWFGNVEHHSLKQRIALTGYGESFFDINRRYVREVLHDRRWKYERALGE